MTVPEAGPCCFTVVTAFRAISVQLASGDKRPSRAVVGIVALVLTLGLDVGIDRIRDPLVSAVSVAMRKGSSANSVVLVTLGAG